MIHPANVSHRFDVLASGGEVTALERAQLFSEYETMVAEKSVDTFGTLGSAGTFGGTFGCLGTLGCCC